MRRRVLILGAAGRDFHNFNVVYRDDASVEVVGFTAAQIPRIDGRTYPAVLAGPHYPEGIAIFREVDLERLIVEHRVDEVVFAYSDVSYEYVGRLAARAQASGASFTLLGPDATMLTASVPVVAVCAVRTGCGKSQTTRYLAQILEDRGIKPVVVRHPMPYGDLAKQAVQRFAEVADLDKHDCTFEEREEYESHIEQGRVVFAGVDYGAILEAASAEGDVVLWDGGNNDFPFYRPDLWITVADPLRSARETLYYPSEVNIRACDLILINKIDSATADQIEAVVSAMNELNPEAAIYQSRSAVAVDDPATLKGKRVLCVEDGPTLTHGGLAIGAGVVAAQRFGGTVVDPRPHFVGSIQSTYEKYPHLGPVLPAMGYYPEQIADLEATIRATDCDLVLVGTPFDLGRQLSVDVPLMRVRYALDPVEPKLITEKLLKVAQP